MSKLSPKAEKALPELEALAKSKAVERAAQPNPKLDKFNAMSDSERSAYLAKAGDNLDPDCSEEERRRKRQIMHLAQTHPSNPHQ
jgi:hypothetical protein